MKREAKRAPMRGGGEVLNPAFDVTPAALIAERGVFKPSELAGQFSRLEGLQATLNFLAFVVEIL